MWPAPLLGSRGLHTLFLWESRCGDCCAIEGDTLVQYAAYSLTFVTDMRRIQFDSDYSGGEGPSQFFSIFFSSFSSQPLMVDLGEEIFAGGYWENTDLDKSTLHMLPLTQG